MATAGLLKSERWHSTIATATLANLRATDRNGFGPDSGGFAGMVGKDLTPEEGWRRIYDSKGGIIRYLLRGTLVHNLDP